jgi:anti-anti-sigma factor
VGIESFDADTLTEAAYSCATQRRGMTSEIVLEGELDLAAKPALEEAIVRALDSGPVDTVIVDLTRVTFADSTTMTWLMHANTRTADASAQLIAIVGPGPVRDVLRLTGIDERLTLVADGRMR